MFTLFIFYAFVLISNITRTLRSGRVQLKRVRFSYGSHSLEIIHFVKEFPCTSCVLHNRFRQAVKRYGNTVQHNSKKKTLNIKYTINIRERRVDTIFTSYS